MLLREFSWAYPGAIYWAFLLAALSFSIFSVLQQRDGHDHIFWECQPTEQGDGDVQRYWTNRNGTSAWYYNSIGSRRLLTTSNPWHFEDEGYLRKLIKFETGVYTVTVTEGELLKDEYHCAAMALASLQE